MDKKIARKIFNIIRNHLKELESFKITLVLKEEDYDERYFCPTYMETKYTKNQKEPTFRITSFYRHYSKGDKYEKSLEFRFGTFLRNLGLEYNVYTKFTLILLHEFGHIYYDSFLFMNDLYREFRLLENNAVNSLSLAFNQELFDELLEEGINAANMFNFTEVLCDNFAFQHFVPVWRKVERLLEKSKDNN